MRSDRSRIDDPEYGIKHEQVSTQNTLISSMSSMNFGAVPRFDQDDTSKSRYPSQQLESGLRMAKETRIKAWIAH